MKSRLFTFGCSFTRYFWPTWADIMALDYDSYQNYGAVGGGNHFIFYSLIESIAREKINSQDTIAIMWTSVGREDRWINGKWVLQGSVYSTYPQEYIDRYTDPTGFYLTNLCVIDATRQILDSIGCKYFFFSTVPFNQIDDSFLKKLLPLKKNVETQILTLYNKTISLIKPSVYEVVFNGDWNNRNHVIIPVAKNSAMIELSEKYHACAGKDWPNFSSFLDDEWNGIQKEIKKEIQEQFHFIEWRDNIVSKRQDFHPTPLEHLMYLESLGFDPSTDQIQFAKKWDNIVLTKEDIKFSRSQVIRL